MTISPSPIASASACALVTFSLAACAPEPADKQSGSLAPQSGAAFASAILSDSDGVEIGQVSLRENDGGAWLEVAVSGLSGSHGFHIHQTADCSADDFTSAGGHLNPQGKAHGAENPAGKHLGDLPNLEANDDGTGAATLPLDYDAEQLKEWLFDDDGAAIVIHAGPDDYTTDPAGAAGPRIACGVLSEG